MIETALAVAGFALCGFVCLLAGGDVMLAAIHLRCARTQIAREHCLPPLPEPENALPLVCVQLPVFNEAAQVEAAVESLCALDWPHRSLQIMILDDSTDDTSAVAARATAHWQSQGFDVRHVRRAHRREFKAGALAAGLVLTEARYLAIFDADYRPMPSFLRDTMRVLLADTNLSFVQARLDYRNREHNMLTRAQALDLDTLLAYEQAARSWAGIPMTFNGTCGVWRRQAIEDAGGWRGNSLAEDQDLSFRAYARGWRGRFLVTVAAAGELPDRFDILATQRQRWSTGTAQSFRRLPWRLVRQLRPMQAILFGMLTLFYATAAGALMAALAITAIVWLVGSSQAATLTVALLLAFAAVVVPRSIGAALASRSLGRPLGWRFGRDLAALWIMQAALLPMAAIALGRGYLSQNLPFQRTPKSGT